VPLDPTVTARPIVPGFALCQCEKCGAEAYLPEGYAPELAGWEYDETKPTCGNHLGVYYMHRLVEQRPTAGEDTHARGPLSPLRTRKRKR